MEKALLFKYYGVLDHSSSKSDIVPDKKDGTVGLEQFTPLC